MTDASNGVSAKADRASRPAAQAPAGLGDTATIPDAKWALPPIEATPHACMSCHTAGAKPQIFPMEGVIGVGFGYAGVTKDGQEVLSEPQFPDIYDADGELLPEDQWPEEEPCPTGADAEALASADPDHDWRIILHAPLSDRTYQRHGPQNWVLVEQGEGFA